MSFLDKIKQKKVELTKTSTIITRADGQKYICDGGDQEKLIEQSSFGFIVDTSPDEIPACVLENRLYLGSQDSVNEDVQTAHGITHILSIGVPAPQPLNVVNKFIECLDLPETDFFGILKASIDFINSAFASNDGKVLVHCNAGVSRSTSVILGFLILERGYKFDEAYALVKAKRPCIQPNAGFMNQLRGLDTGNVPLM
jgi:hypothetical protein